MAGLAAALAASRHGHDVLLLERDVFERGAGARAFGWTRKGIPHFHQPHAFQPRGRLLLQQDFPDVYRALLRAGACEVELATSFPGEPQPDDHELTFLAVRRPLIEWALREALRKEKRATIASGRHVAGLLGRRGAIPRVEGVSTAEGEEFRGALVVDALGRTTPVPGWLAAMGATPPETASGDCGCVYYSRYYELLRGVKMRHRASPLGPRGDLGYAAFTTFLGDNRTYAIALIVPTWDQELRILREESAFVAACRAVPGLEPLVSSEVARPITPVMPMGSLQNTIRRYVRDGRLGAVGIVPAADAFYHTDPSFALGLSNALVHARALIAALQAHPSDVAEAALAYFAATTGEAEERFQLACETDAARLRAWRGEAVDALSRTACYPLFVMMAAGVLSRVDGEIARRLARRMSFLDRTGVFDNDLELQQRIEALLPEAIKAHPLPAAGPGREELLARVVRAAAVGT